MEYLTLLLGWWWLVLTGGVLTVWGAYTDFQKIRRRVPRHVLFVAGAVLIFVAQYLAFTEMQGQRDEAKGALAVEQSTSTKGRIRGLEKANRQRQIDDAALVRLRSALAKIVADPSNPPAVVIVPMFSDTESGIYAEQIVSVFRDAGWKRVGRGVYRRAPLYGLRIQGPEKLSPLVDAIRKIFTEAGIDVACNITKSDGGNLEIIVGTKPPPDYASPSGACVAYE